MTQPKELSKYDRKSTALIPSNEIIRIHATHITTWLGGHQDGSRRISYEQLIAHKAKLVALYWEVCNNKKFDALYGICQAWNARVEADPETADFIGFQNLPENDNNIERVTYDLVAHLAATWPYNARLQHNESGYQLICSYPVPGSQRGDEWVGKNRKLRISLMRHIWYTLNQIIYQMELLQAAEKETNHA